MFPDTESLVSEIKAEDVYEDFYEVKDLFDLIGKMKDEFKGKIISEFIRLKPKMYSLIAVDGEENKKAKGVNKNVVKNINHKEYIDVLFNEKMIRHKMKRIQSKLHKIKTSDVCRISLSCFDDKRYILGDGIDSLAYFHSH